MSEPQKDDDTKRGDEILRRLLKTPPDPKGKTIKPERTARVRLKKKSNVRED